MRVNTQVKSILTGAGETARADPRELLRMLEHLELGDVVTVTRIDRLARSTFDLISIVKRIVDARASPILGGTVGRHGHQQGA